MSEPQPDTAPPAGLSPEPDKPVAAPPPGPAPLTPEEQMALYEKDLQENDWGHQPC